MRVPGVAVSGRLNPGRASWLAASILPHEAGLRRWLLRRGCLAGELDDIVQESYAALAGLADVAHIGDPRAYFFRTAWSIRLRQLRRAKVIAIEAVADLTAFDPVSDQPDAERQLSGRQELRRLAAAIETLPARCRDVFKLRKIESLSQREVADRLGLSESTVEKHVARAVRLLGDVLASDSGDDGRVPAGRFEMRSVI